MSNWKEYKYVLIVAILVFIVIVVTPIVILLNKDKSATKEAAEVSETVEQIDNTIVAESVEEDWTAAESTTKLVEDITANLADEDFVEKPISQINLITFAEASNSFAATFPLNSVDANSGFNWGDAQAKYNASYEEIVVFDDILSYFISIVDVDVMDLKYSMEGPLYYISDWDYNFALEDSNNYYTFFVKDNLVGYFIDAK